MGQIVSNEIIIKREDLIGKYTGWTIPRTKKLLDENLGKTIKIIDNLIIDPNDLFGLESMNEIKLFLSKHPNQIIYHKNEIIKGYNIDWNKGYVVTRSDFVGRYTGSTKFKTNNLLNDNIGKTLLIVGKFIINKNDYYCIEAMNEIKDFLNKHPNEIIKINGIKIENNNIIKDEDPNIIKIRRHNLIGQHLGQSYHNTINFLLSNLDKTIIIMDDLVTGYYDNMGKDIEKAIIDFLNQYPKQIKIKYYTRPNSCA
jgi:hypothetical protein